jgi:hypothetical protein
VPYVASGNEECFANGQGRTAVRQADFDYGAGFLGNKDVAKDVAVARGHCDALKVVLERSGTRRT